MYKQIHTILYLILAIPKSNKNSCLISVFIQKYERAMTPLIAMDYAPPKTPELWQPDLTQFPTSNVACVNCCKIVRTVTTYAPGPKACFLGTMSFVLG